MSWTREKTVYGSLIRNEGGKDLGIAGDVPLIEQDGFAFKDLARTGELLPYEDWRLDPETRAADLAGRLSREEIAGLMLYSSHQMVPFTSQGPFSDTYGGEAFDPGKHDDADLTDGQIGFLPFSEAFEPLSGGQRVVVQVRKPPVGEKAAYLTEDLSLAGRWAILLPRSGKTAVSSRVTEEEVKAALLKTARSQTPAGMGLILRKESAGIPEAEIRAEIEGLLSLWDQIKERAKAGSAPALLWPGRSPLERALDDWERPDRLTADREMPVPPGIELVVHPHPFSLYSVLEQRHRLLQRRVWLPGGGFLVVDPCEAMTVIDVNTGKNTGRGADKEALFLKTNLEAAQMIARLLRVRGVGGIIVIDFIDMETEAARAQVLDALRTLSLRDPVKCVVHGFTALGLVEMTRKKSEIPGKAPQDVKQPAVSEG